MLHNMLFTERQRNESRGGQGRTLFPGRDIFEPNPAKQVGGETVKKLGNFRFFWNLFPIFRLYIVVDCKEVFAAAKCLFRNLLSGSILPQNHIRLR